MSAYSILSAYGAFWTPFSCFTLCCWVSQLCVTPWTGARQLPWPLLLFFKTQVWGCFHRHGSLACRTLPAPGPLLSEQWSRWLMFTVYPSRLRYVLWPQGLWPLPHSSTDTGESIQWLWTASLPVQALTSAHSPGALRGVVSVGASQGFRDCLLQWPGDKISRQGNVSMGDSENPQEINSSLKVGAWSKGCRANWKALIPAMELLCLMRSCISDSISNLLSTCYTSRIALNSGPTDVFT